jgi:hypothetical protein
MTEFLKTNVSMKEVIGIIVMLIPLIIAWEQLTAKIEVQAAELKAMQLELANQKHDVRENYNSLNLKLDKVLEDVGTIKVEMQNKKNRD